MTEVISPQRVPPIHMRQQKSSPPLKSARSLPPPHSRQQSLEGGTERSESGTMINAKAQGVNKKLMRLAVDSRSSTKRQSIMFDESGAAPIKTEITVLNRSFVDETIPCHSIKQKRPDSYDEELTSENARFPRIEEMSHFHYVSVDFGESHVKVSLCHLEKDEISTLDNNKSLLVEVNSKDKSWIVKRSLDDFVGFDRQIHRCLYDRRYSNLPELKDCDEGTKLDETMVQQMQYYLSRFSEIAGNNVNCGPILNWLELDNHGNHLVVMEADDSAINVPAVAAGRAIKRYQAQAPDEMSLEVGDFLSVIDMPSSDETIWWRGKKGFEVGFFPSHCIEILNEKEINDQILHHLQSRPVSKRRGKFISFLRFFFKSRPSKDELMQHGILRERVFGCDLGERLALTGRDTPLVLDMCAEVIEEHGIVDGIYRLSGIVSNLQKLRIAFDCDDQPPNLRDSKYLNDVHCISSLLKTYFRELPNPLFTYELYDKFVTAFKKEDDTERTVAFHHVIQRLPPPHYRTMNKLLRHLNYCASKSDGTNMTAKNLAIVWAPNLLRPSSDDSVAALTEFRTQAIIVEYMIRNVDVFFDKNLASAAIAYYPEIKQSHLQEDNECIRLGMQTNSAPKLISLEEARQRVHKQRQLTKTISLDGGANSPRHNKLRATIAPPKVSAAPISPLPTLLSIEEAQARTKSKVVHGQRNDKSSSSNESRNVNGTNSPRRARKWFGLFARGGSSKSVTNADDENTQIKASMSLYSRKQIPVVTPQRSQSEYRLHDIQSQQQQRGTILRSESFSSTSSADRQSLSLSLSNPSAMTPDCEYNVNDSDADSISLMSAIVSVTAKYINLDDSNRYRSPSKPIFTVGDPSGFRKLDDEEVLVKPPSSTTPETPPAFESQDIKTASVPYSSHRRGAPSNDSGYLSQTSTLNRNSSDTYSTETPITLSPERKSLRSSGRTKRDTEEDIPVKRVRSLSPETYDTMNTNIDKKSMSETAEKINPIADEVLRSNYMNVDESDIVLSTPRSKSSASPPPISNETTPRLSTSNVTAHYGNIAESVASVSPLTNMSFPLEEEVFGEDRDNPISPLCRSKSLEPSSISKAPSLMKETLFGPPELFSKETLKFYNKDLANATDERKNSLNASVERTITSTPTRTHFSFTRARSLSAKADYSKHQRNIDVITQKPSYCSDINVHKKDDNTNVLRSRSSSNRDNVPSPDTRRLSVREKAALFGQVSPITTTCTSWNKPTVSEEKTKSSPNLSILRNSENTSACKRITKSTKKMQSENHIPGVTDTPHVSTKDFDNQCRVSENQTRFSSLAEDSSLDTLSRSADRLARSSRRRVGNDFQQSNRPQSEIISNFDYRSFDDKMIRLKTGRFLNRESSPKHNYLYNSEQFRKISKSENRLSGSDNGQQVAHLTFRTSSVHIPQERFSDKRSGRPRSLYDNDRRSHYDNMGTSHYEMV